MRRAGTSSTAENAEVAEEDQKVIVRSNGTVGYVGKDIAYHMWKFGLLGKDFGYRKFSVIPTKRIAGFPQIKAKRSTRISAEFRKSTM